MQKQAMQTRGRVSLAVGLLITPAPSSAQTGVCSSNPPTSTQACLDAMGTAGVLTDDIFRDTNGLTADQVPLYGVLFNNWPGCISTNSGGCSGQSLQPYDCPGQYSCSGAI